MGAPCSPPSQLYTNSALTIAQNNPLSTDAYGNYKAFVSAGLYLLQVSLGPGGPTYTYYVSAGTSSTAAGPSPPPYSVQFASPTTGLFSSDSSITINPTSHILQTPELLVPGSGTGVIGITGTTSGLTVSQTVADSTAAWTYIWPSAPAPTSGTNCLTGVSAGTVTTASFQPCTLVGAYLPLAGGTLTGPLLGTSASFVTTNSVVNPAMCGTSAPPSWCAGTDIGAWINASFASSACNLECTIYVPAGAYNQTTTIRVPEGQLNTYELKFDRAAILTYQGSGDIIDGYISTSGPTISNLSISGGTFINAGSATAGVHLQPTNTVRISNMVLEQITGPAIWMEGVNAAWITDNLIINNTVGVEETPTFCSGATCGPGVSGIAFSPNAIHILNNTIANNGQWGVWFFDVVTGALPGALNNEITGNDLETNGTAGAAYGAVNVGRSTGMVISRNYFEGSPEAIQLGIPGGNDATTRYFASQGVVVRDNYFTLQDNLQTPPAGTYQINLLDTANAVIEGNATQGVKENVYSCFVNTLAKSGLNVGETGTFLSKNHFETDINTNVGNYTCVAGVGGPLVGAGSSAIANTNYQTYLAYANWAANATLTTENVAIQNVTTSGTCFIYPISANARTSFAAQTTYVASVGTAQITINHPATASLDWNIYCSNMQN